MTTEKICQLIDERKQELFELLASLVKINSENFSSYGNEEECARYVKSLLDDLGLETDLYSPMDIKDFDKHPDYMPGHGLENRYNIVSRWKGKENTDELMLMAHTDTVRIGDRAAWSFEPLAGIIKDGKIMGRGAVDDKYAVATSIFIMKLLKEAGFEPKKNLLFAGYVDEEYGGAHGALAAVLKYPCQRIVSMDGRDGQIWNCASGGGEFKYLYHAKEIQDSAKLTAQAIPTVLECIETFADKRKAELEENCFYKGTIIPKTALRYMGVRAGKDGLQLGTGEAYFICYTDKTKEEIYAELSELEKVLAEKLEPMGIIGDGFVPQTRFFHYVFTEPDSEDITLMLEAAKETNSQIPIVCGSCLSDLSVISKYGSKKAFSFGAGRDFSKPGGAHQVDEYIECDKLVKYTKTVAAYVLKVLG